MISTQSNTSIPRPTPLTTPNGIQIQSAVLPQYTLRTDRQTDRQTDTQTDRPTDQPTDGLGNKSVLCTNTRLRLIEYSDVAKNCRRHFVSGHKNDRHKGRQILMVLDCQAIVILTSTTVFYRIRVYIQCTPLKSDIYFRFSSEILDVERTTILSRM